MSAATSKPAILGPVFQWELIRVSRRGLWHLCRFLFAASLLLYLYSQVGDRVLRVTELSEFSAGLAALYVVAQFLAVLVFTPLLTCGAILEERNQRTLPLLLASLLHPSEVVQGKLMGRLLGLLTIILTGLPIVALLQFLGGINFVMLLQETGIALLLMLVLGINGIYQSSRARTLGGAVARTYVQTAMHYLIAWMILLPPGLICFHLLGMSIYTIMTIGGHFLACGFALIGLRRLTMNLPALALEHSTSELQFMEKFNAWTDVSHWMWRLKSSFGTPREAWEYRFQTQYHHDAEQDGDVAIRYYRVPDVSDQPLLWKDTWLPLDRRVQWLLTAGSIILTVFVFGFIMAAVNTSHQSPTIQRLLNLLTYAIMLGVLTMVGLRATSTLPLEHQLKTLDDLLMWPWSATQLLWQKWMGVMRRYRMVLLMVCLFSLPMVAWVKGAISFWLIPVFVTQVCCVASLGLLLSLLCRLRGILTRVAGTIVALGVLILMPIVLDHWWKHAPTVMLPANRPTEQRILRGAVVLERKDVIHLTGYGQARKAGPTYWLHIAHVVRNTLCPVEAWNDLLHRREYWLTDDQSVPFHEAIETNSPWHVHAVTSFCLLAASGFLFGCSVLMLRRWRSA